MEAILARESAAGAPVDFRGGSARLCAIARRFRYHTHGRGQYSGKNANSSGSYLRRGGSGQWSGRAHARARGVRRRATDPYRGESPESSLRPMLQARLRKTFPQRPDSVGFSLDLEFKAAAGVTVLFGPSGSGKTQVLDSIAGFTRPDEGRILLDDDLLFDAATGVHLPPQARNCGYVFQNYALFPHMTLRQNLMFAAERRPRLERHRRVNEMLDTSRLTKAAGRRRTRFPGGSGSAAPSRER